MLTEPFTEAAILQSLPSAIGAAFAVVGKDGRVEWGLAPAGSPLGRLIRTGLRLSDELQRHAPLIEDRAGLPGVSFSAPLRNIDSEWGEPLPFRHVIQSFGPEKDGKDLHVFLDATSESRLERHFLLNLQQLNSMKEIVDILYESLSTPEVVYLCLVAVTAQMGFGFNRAFFLQVQGRRVRGRIGIGPSSPEEANEIWSRLIDHNVSSLRDIFRDLTAKTGIPDPQTQEIALQIEFELEQDGLLASAQDATETRAGIREALLRGKPAKLRPGDAVSDVDTALFGLLAAEEVAVVPLFVRGVLAGVILADNIITRKPISDGDLNVLKTFAGYAGVALERSHLYDELRESVVKLQNANDTLKRHQEKLLKAEKLSAIGELAAYVTHEIRNPLVAIGGLARSLASDMGRDPETGETLQLIVSEVTRLEKFLRETLDFVKPRVIGAVTVDVAQLARQCVATFKKELPEKGIELELDLPSEPVECRTDPDLFLHSLTNLLKNAIEAMRSGGRLQLSVQRGGPAAIIRVADTGVGIPQEVRPRIFDPFFTTKPEGTGLGLSMASQSIKEVGGRLELEDEPPAAGLAGGEPGDAATGASNGPTSRSRRASSGSQANNSAQTNAPLKSPFKTVFKMTLPAAEATRCTLS